MQATAGYQRLELMLPNLGTIGYQAVAIAKNFQFLKVGTDGSQRGNQRLPWQGTAGSQRLELMFSKPSNYHCKELPVGKA